MSLLLRTQISRPLTHEELDSNLKFLYVKPWEYDDYRLNQLIYIKGDDNISRIYRCIEPHVRYVYDPSKEFSITVALQSELITLWEEIANTGGGDGGSITGATISDIVLNGTELILIKSNGGTLEEDLNELTLSGAQYKKGITTHDFITLTEDDFNEIDFDTVFIGGPATLSENVQLIGYNFTDFPAKETTILINIDSTDDQHFIIKLPDISELSTSSYVGKRLRVFVKRNNISNKSKNLMLASDWLENGTRSRILCVSAATEYEDLGYFLPLESMEVIDLFWDGDDWIALNANKRDYVHPDALNFTNQDTEYINRP